MIRYRNGAYEITVNVGLDPVTGKRRQVSRSVRVPERKRVPDEVLNAEAKLRLEVAAGQHGAPSVTVGDLLDRWLAHVRADLSPTTLDGYERKIRLYLRPALGDVRLARLTTARIDALYRSLRATGGEAGKGVSAQTIRHVHAILRRALNQARRWGWIERNPAEHAEPPSVRRDPVEAPGAHEITQLLEATDRNLVDLVALAAATGARRGELCGLRWGDIDLDAGQVIIRRSIIDVGHKLAVKPPKSGRARAVAIGPRLVERLKARHARMATTALACGVGLKPDAYVLSPSPDGREPLHPNLASHRFGRLARKLNLSLHLHDLRHAAVTLALAAGAPVHDVAEYVGHSSSKTTLDIYAHTIPSGQRFIAEVLDRNLG